MLEFHFHVRNDCFFPLRIVMSSRISSSLSLESRKTMAWHLKLNISLYLTWALKLQILSSENFWSLTRHFREFFQAKQLQRRCKLRLTGNSYYVIYLKVKTQQSLHNSKAMLIAIWSWKGFSLMHKWWSARNACRKVTLSAVSDIDYCWSQRATLLDPYTLAPCEELSFPDVINWTHNAITISFEVHIDQVTTTMSWQNLT